MSVSNPKTASGRYGTVAALGKVPEDAQDEESHPQQTTTATSTMHDSERQGGRHEPPVDRSDAHGESKKEEGESTIGPQTVPTVPIVPMNATALVAEMHADLERLRDASEAHDRARSDAMSRLQDALGSGRPATIRRRFGSGGGSEVSANGHVSATDATAKVVAASSDAGTDAARTAGGSPEDHDAMLTAVLGCKAGGDAKANDNADADLGLFSKYGMRTGTAPRRALHHLTSFPNVATLPPSPFAHPALLVNISALASEPGMMSVGLLRWRLLQAEIMVRWSTITKA